MKEQYIKETMSSINTTLLEAPCTDTGTRSKEILFLSGKKPTAFSLKTISYAEMLQKPLNSGEGMERDQQYVKMLCYEMLCPVCIRKSIFLSINQLSS